MLSDFAALLRAFVRAATVVDGLEGYPIFLPPRSMAEVEFVEMLERPAGGWRIGTQPHSRARARTRRRNDNTPDGKLTIEAPPGPERNSSPLAPSSIPSPAPVKALLLQAPGTLFDPLLPSTTSPAPHSALALVPPTLSPSPVPALHGNIDLAESLECVRIILAPVAERQRARAEQNTLEKRKLASSPSPSSTSTSSASSACGDGVGNMSKGKAKPLPINILLHGPQVVEVVLTWLAAVLLVELQSVALPESGDGG